MTRRGSIILCGFVLLFALLGLQSWSIAVARVEQRVIAAIEARTGLVVTGMERAEIALLPLPRISLSNVAFAERERQVAGRALRIRAHARLLPLLVGRIDFDRIDLVAPEIDLAVTAGDGSLPDLLGAPLGYLESLQGQSRIVVTSGSFFLRSQGAIRTILRDVNLVLDEREATEPVAIAGSLNWRGVPTEVNLLWPVASGPGRATLNVSAPLLKLQFDGSRNNSAEPTTAGHLTLATPSLPDLLAWFGEAPRLAPAVGALNLTAEALIRPHDVALGNVVARLDGDRLDGALNLGLAAGRLALSGTLAGAQLDLGRMISRLEVANHGGTGDDAPLPFEAWTAQDIDLRVSVETARIDGTKLGDVATYLLVKKGRFETGILRAGAYGGSVKGRLLATAAPTGIDVKLTAALDKVSFGEAGNNFPRLARLSGTGNVQLNLEGFGRSRQEVLASASGRASLNLRQGELAGFAFGDLLRRAERSPTAALRDWRQGRTAFETASASAVIANGVLTLADAQMAGAGYRMTLTGTASLPTRELDMAVQLQPANGGALRLPFSLRGPIADPSLELEPEAILRPSGSSLLPLR